MEKDTGTFWVVEEYTGSSQDDANLVYTESFLNEDKANETYTNRCIAAPDNTVTIRKIERLLLSEGN